MREACPYCGSSDGVSTETNAGWAHCFACDKNWKEGTAMKQTDDDEPVAREFIDVEFGPLKKRGLHEDTLKKYRYGTSTYKGKPCQVAQFFNNKGTLVAQKLRFANKDFVILGNGKQVGSLLYGMQTCRQGGKRIIITEGEHDCHTMSQVQGNTWPVVSLPNGASNLKALEENLEFLESYDQVVLCFDNDDPGQKATAKAVELFSPGKVAVMDLHGYKDANDALLDGQEKMLRGAAWEAKEYRPDGIVCLSDIRERIEAPLVQGVLYPWAGLNSMLYGFRSKELITWTAGTGVGKTALVSELAYSLVTTGQKVGLIYLEEGVERAGRRLIGIHMNKPLHLPGVEYDEAEFEAAWQATLGTGRVFAYDHFGSLDSDVLLNRVRHLVKGLGVDTVVLDHISMVVSGSDLDVDERRLLDRTMTNLRSLTQETGASLHVVSHLRRPPGSGSHEEGLAVQLSHLRGTQAIAQLSDAVIAAERDQQADDPADRDITTLRVLKNRYAGITGVADKLRYDRKTGRLVHVGIGDGANPGAAQVDFGTERDF